MMAGSGLITELQDRQTAGIDLPFKALAWEDEAGRTWLTYNDPMWLATRHGLRAESRAAINAIAEGMALLVAAAAGEAK
jgi:uncharacterized protein (DUF302 family)